MSNSTVAFSWGYDGWGPAVPQLLESTRLAEERRGFGTPFFVDIRFRRAVRASGFRDRSFETLAGSARTLWMPRLGNKNIVNGGNMELADPSAAADLFDIILKMEAENRRVIFFCACKAPAGPNVCHRWLVRAELEAVAKSRGLLLELEEWPGGKPSGHVDRKLAENPECLDAVRTKHKSMPVPPDLDQGEAASLAWGSVIQLGEGENPLFVLTGPATVHARKWTMPIYMGTEFREDLVNLFGEAPYVRCEKSHKDDLYTPSALLAPVVGAEDQTLNSIYKRLGIYMRGHGLDDDNAEETVRTDPLIEAFVGRRGQLPWKELIEKVSEQLQPASSIAVT